MVQASGGDSCAPASASRDTGPQYVRAASACSASDPCERLGPSIACDSLLAEEHADAPTPQVRPEPTKRDRLVGIQQDLLSV